MLRLRLMLAAGLKVLQAVSRLVGIDRQCNGEFLEAVRYRGDPFQRDTPSIQITHGEA